MLFTYAFNYDERFTPAEAARADEVFHPTKIAWHEEKKEGQETALYTYSSLTSTLDVALSFGKQLRDLKRQTFPGMPESWLDDKVLDMLKQAMALNFNKKVEVHVPGDALLKITKVQVVEDSCTDNIQALLNEGWRILAVCPQSQRRPDYVLGM